MFISIITLHLPSRPGPVERQLMSRTANLGCRGLFLLDGIWGGLPPIAMQGARFYSSFSSLLHIDYPLRELAHRTRLAFSAWQQGDRGAACSNGLQAIGSALNTLSFLGHNLMTFAPKPTAVALNKVLKPMAIASPAVSIVSTSCTHLIVLRTIRYLKLQKEDALPASIHLALATCLDARTYADVLKQNSVYFALEKVKIQSTKPRSKLLQMILSSAVEIISKKYPVNQFLAGFSFANDAYSLAEDIYDHISSH